MNNIDWNEVENKISLILYKFQNLSAWHEDLAQELRVHAYYVSDNYYDLYRKAIDFWRKVQTRCTPEVPYFDLEVLGASYKDKEINQLGDTVTLIRKELNRPGNNKWDEKMLDVCKMLLDIILSDIDPSLQEDSTLGKDENSYINKRLNLSTVSANTGIGYKRLVSAMQYLEDTVLGLASMHRIEIPLEYFRDYYDK